LATSSSFLTRSESLAFEYPVPTG